MIEVKLTRRDFIKSNAVAAAATVAGISVPNAVMAQQAGKGDGVRWDKNMRFRLNYSQVIYNINTLSK